MPTTLPMAAPNNASFDAPTRLAPSSVATRSTAIANAVSTPRMVSVGQPMRRKSPIHAATTSPKNTNGTPGNAGNSVPASPIKTSTAASPHSK